MFCTSDPFIELRFGWTLIGSKASCWNWEWVCPIKWKPPLEGGKSSLMIISGFNHFSSAPLFTFKTDCLMELCSFINAFYVLVRIIHCFPNAKLKLIFVPTASKCGVETKTIAVDFSATDIYSKIEEGLAGLEIGVLGKTAASVLGLFIKFNSHETSKEACRL